MNHKIKYCIILIILYLFYPSNIKMYLNIEITQNSLIHILDMIKHYLNAVNVKINDNYQLCKVGQHKYKVNNNDFIFQFI